MQPAPPILEVRDLCVEYATAGRPVGAVDHVSLDLGAGEFLAIVGESGCGKSTLLFAIARLLSPPARVVAGAVRFKGRDMLGMSERDLREVRWREFSVVMQSAMNALNPVMTIGAQLGDAMTAHARLSARAVQDRSREVLRLIGIDPIHLRAYPHQLSGGMRQRAMIAMALLFTPDLVIMAEPTSAVDVVAQRSLMVQIKELQQQLGFAVLFVTHDMSLVSHFSDRLAVMYAGQVVEVGATRTLFAAPQHPYTRGLMAAFPSIRGARQSLRGIPGTPPDLGDAPPGCRFHPRCPSMMDRCRSDPPVLAPVSQALVRCHLYDDDVPPQH